MTDAQIIADILAREGGYSDNPADAGGPTNWGVTLAVLAAWRGHPVTDSDVRALTEGEALQIYEARYIKAPGFDNIDDDRLRALIVDCGVNSGPATATRWLQKALGVLPDGAIGSQTVAALKTADPRHVGIIVCAIRMRFRGHLVTNKPSQAVFAEGWANRDAALLETFA